MDLPARFPAGVAALDRGELEAAEQIFRGILAEDPLAHPVWNAAGNGCGRA